MHLLIRYAFTVRKDELLSAAQKYVSEFRSKFTPGVIQMKKRHKTIRN